MHARMRAKRAALRIVQRPIEVATRAIADFASRHTDGHPGRVVGRVLLLDYWNAEGGECQTLVKRVPDDGGVTLWWAHALVGWYNDVHGPGIPWRPLPGDDDLKADLEHAVYAVAGVWEYTTCEALAFNAMACLEAIERTAGFWYDSREEFVARTWAPERHVDWCLCTDERRQLDEDVA